MFSKEMESLIEATLQDGVLTDQEKAVLVKRATKEGIDVDELDIYIQSLLQKRHQKEAEEDALNDRESKVGSIMKCPICGGVIQPGFAVCPHCGNALNTENVSSTVENLTKKLQEEDDALKLELSKPHGFLHDTDKDKELSINRKFSIITSTPVRNNRGDLLELLAFSKAKADKKAPKDGCARFFKGSRLAGENLGYAYWCLFESCIGLAQASFNSDPAFKVYFDFYEKEKKTTWQKLFGR